MNRKIKLLRRVIEKSDEILPQMKQSSLEQLTAIAELSQQRHKLVHSVVARFIFDHKETETLKTIYRAKEFEYERRTVRYEDFDKFIEAAIKLTTQDMGYVIMAISEIEGARGAR